MAETELANAAEEARDDERVTSVSVGLMPLIEQLSLNAVEPTKSWCEAVRVAAVQLEDAQRAKKDGSAIDPERLRDQAEELIAALTRIRPA